MNSYPSANRSANRRQSNFKFWLLAGAVLTLIFTIPPSIAVADDAPPYFKVDGSKTVNLEEAAQSWRDDPEFRANWGQVASKVEYAYARGISGKGVDLGVIDTVTDRRHSEFSGNGKLNSIDVTGTRTSSDPNSGGPRTGDQFNLIGNDPQQFVYGNKYKIGRYTVC